jgi:hypothetical protein
VISLESRSGSCLKRRRWSPTSCVAVFCLIYAYLLARKVPSTLRRFGRIRLPRRMAPDRPVTGVVKEPQNDGALLLPCRLVCQTHAAHLLVAYAVHSIFISTCQSFKRSNAAGKRYKVDAASLLQHTQVVTLLRGKRVLHATRFATCTACAATPIPHGVSPMAAAVWLFRPEREELGSALWSV